MNNYYSSLKQFLVLCICAIFLSCNDSAEKKADEPVTTADTPAVAPDTTVTAAFVPFDVMEISHTIKDYKKWRPLFNDDSTARRASGLEDIVVGRSIDHPDNILVVLRTTDIQKAKDFAADPRLKAAMEKGGVVSKPDIQYFNIIRYNPDANEKQWVRVTHRVKNFDEWLKVFDNEGTAARASQGLIDVALGRSIANPDIVTIVFDISDLPKAKASIQSEEKKNLMKTAGVIGAPKIEFYTTAD